jgi:hypothetical protein
MPVLDGRADFDTAILPRLLALPFFRLAPDHELDVAYAAYQRGEWGALCDVWATSCAAQRATLTSGLQRGYDRAGLLPRAVNAQGFLASVRAVLDAGVRFRAGLSPALRASLEHDFPWLEHRHEHVPPGWTPPFSFPSEFAAWLEEDGAGLDAARARWQLAAALNEVQQAHNSADCARRFRLPELDRHAARERELALNYLAHWAPECTRAAFRECILSLDALNAAVFALLCVERPGEMIGRSLLGALTGKGEWKAFVAALDLPQRLLLPQRRSA